MLKLDKLESAKEKFEKIQQEFENIEKDKNYWLIKLLILSQTYEKEENNELKEEIINICDKINIDFNGDKLVEEIQKHHTQQ